MASNDPKRSEGARLERAAFRAVIRRRFKKAKETEAYDGTFATDALDELLTWVLERQKRYDKKQGGL